MTTINSMSEEGLEAAVREFRKGDGLGLPARLRTAITAYLSALDTPAVEAEPVAHGAPIEEQGGFVPVEWLDVITDAADAFHILAHKAKEDGAYEQAGRLRRLDNALLDILASRPSPPEEDVRGPDDPPLNARALHAARAEANALLVQSDFADSIVAAYLAALPSTFQDRVAEAHVALFDGDPTDLAERRNRFGEESNEVCQALGMTREEAHQLVDYTYNRPVGEPEKEIGAAVLTLASLCVVGGWDMQACAEADLTKLQQPETIARIRAKRSTRHGRGPLPGLSPAPPSDQGEVAGTRVTTTFADFRRAARILGASQ